MTERPSSSDATFFQSFEGFELIPTIVRLIAEGNPVSVGQIASAANSTVKYVERVLRSEVGTEWDDDGRLVGLGLTLRPTAHHFTTGGRDLYTWCATDTLLFATILDTSEVIESTCPATGQPIRIELEPSTLVSVSPVDAVVSQRHCAELVDDLRAQVCDHGHFFASSASAESWLAEHPDGEVLSVGAAFERCQATCSELGWFDRARTPR
ncbi:MAG: organomercurial lyase MerB [Acidimicrobiales bacterium]